MTKYLKNKINLLTSLRLTAETSLVFLIYDWHNKIAFIALSIIFGTSTFSLSNIIFSIIFLTIIWIYCFSSSKVKFPKSKTKLSILYGKGYTVYTNFLFSWSLCIKAWSILFNSPIAL